MLLAMPITEGLTRGSKPIRQRESGPPSWTSHQRACMCMMADPRQRRPCRHPRSSAAGSPLSVASPAARPAHNHRLAQSGQQSTICQYLKCLQPAQQRNDYATCRDFTAQIWRQFVGRSAGKEALKPARSQRTGCHPAPADPKHPSSQRTASKIFTCSIDCWTLPPHRLRGQLLLRYMES